MEGKVILGKFEEEVTVNYTGYVNITIKDDHGNEANALLFEQGALELIEQIQEVIEKMRKDRAPRISAEAIFI